MNKSRRIKGFTLVELVVVIVIMSILTAVLLTPIQKAFTLYFSGTQANDSEWQINVAMSRFQRDIQAVRSSSDWLLADSKSLSFVDDQGNTIVYELTGQQLLRTFQPAGTTGATPQVLAGNVDTTNSNFRYFNGSGAALTPLPLSTQLPNIRYTGFFLQILNKNNGVAVSDMIFYARNVLP